jgi:hypothetical protein
MSIDQAIATKQLATLVTRDSIVGTGLPKSPKESAPGAER